MKLLLYIYIYISVVLHKAVAEVSKIGNLEERLVSVNHGWQSKSTDGPTGDWSCVFLEWLQWLQWSPGRSPHPQLLDVVWCSAAVVVVVV